MRGGKPPRVAPGVRGNVMNGVKRRRRTFVLILTVGVGVLVWSNGVLGAERREPADPYKGIRESTLRYVALGTPDDLLRLLDARDKTEQELQRLKLDLLPEGQEQLVQQQKELKNLKDRLAESQTLLQLLGATCLEKKAKRQPGDSSAQDRLVADLCGRNDEVRKRIDGLEKEVRSGKARYLLSLEEEKGALVRLLSMRKEWLVEEYAANSDPSACSVDARKCLRQKLKILCRLQLLVSDAEQLGIQMLIHEVDNQLKVSHYPSATICDYDRHDFGM
jgi:hypothetical protein